MATKRKGAPLTAAFVRNVSKPGRYGDGRGGYGLSLLVRKTANGRTSKIWCQAFNDPITGRPTSISFGKFPIVTLAEARRKALEHRRMIEQGHHPRFGGVPSFETATDQTIELHSKGWKPGSRTAIQWRNSFEAHAGRLAGKRIDKITTADVLAVVGPLWAEKPGAAKLLKLRLGQVFKWSIAQGYRSDNPAGEALVAALPKANGNKRKHYRALHHGEVAEALAKIEGSGTAPATRLAIRFIALTASRTAEVRGARWSEIDTKAGIWTIPGERMKAGRAHRVPLSGAALKVLEDARQRWGTDGLVFPGRQVGKPLGHGSIAGTFRRLELATPHGLRSSFRDWCGESGVAREVAEQALAHVVGGTEGAYARSDLLNRRRAVMEGWGSYIT